jgi:hypothetical protein
MNTNVDSPRTHSVSLKKHSTNSSHEGSLWRKNKLPCSRGARRAPGTSPTSLTEEQVAGAVGGAGGAVSRRGKGSKVKGRGVRVNKVNREVREAEIP